MKIYRNMKSIAGNNLIYIFMLGLFLPISLWPLLSALSDEKAIQLSGFRVVFILLLMCSIGVALYMLYVLLVHLWGMNQPTIEITASGIRYPYLLRHNPEITWAQIKKFEYVRDRSGRHTDYYIVVELENGLDLGDFRNMPGLSLLKTVQKRYDHQILILFDDIIKDYSLSDLTDRLNAERKRMTEPRTLIHTDESIFYSKNEIPLSRQLKLIAAASVGFLAPSYLLTRDGDSSFTIFTLIFGAAMVLIILKLFYDRIREFFSPDIAISFTQEGIVILDDQKFSSPIVWKDILRINIEEKHTNNKFGEPILVIELAPFVNTKKKHYVIANQLKDTSVYEVMHSLEYYWQ